MMHRYPVESLVWDYARAGLGTATCGIPLLAMDLSRVVFGVFLALTLLFAVYGVQTLRRQRTALEATPQALVLHPGAVRIDWNELTGLRLAYFSLRREGAGGWMELKLHAGRHAVRVDSRIEGFREIVELAAGAATRVDLELDPATASNLATLELPSAAQRHGEMRSAT